MSRFALFELTKHDQRRKIFPISSNKDYTILVQQVLFEKYWNTIWSYNLQQQLINLNGNYKSYLFHIPPNPHSIQDLIPRKPILFKI